MSAIESRAGKPASGPGSKPISAVPSLVVAILGVSLSIALVSISSNSGPEDVETTVTGAVYAESLTPGETRNIDLGPIAGSAWYTVEQDGYHLVVSLQALETGTPLRFVATLRPEQRVMFSAPRRAGEPMVDMRFIRHGERIDVNIEEPRLEARRD
jgi:hypothetical protein